MTDDIDPLEDVRRNRAALTARFGNDVRALAEWLRESATIRERVEPARSGKPAFETSEPAEAITT